MWHEKMRSLRQMQEMLLQRLWVLRLVWLQLQSLGQMRLRLCRQGVATREYHEVCHRRRWWTTHSYRRGCFCLPSFFEFEF